MESAQEYFIKESQIDEQNLSLSNNDKYCIKLMDDYARKNLREQAPLIIHQSLCCELVELAKVNPNKFPKDVEGGQRILDTISHLEQLYPKLKEK